MKHWRDLGWPDITPVTRALLDHWHAEDRFRPLFFCQLEALETLIFITEVAKQTKYGHDWIEKYLREKADEAGTELFRVACKMATGSGKTVVMSMLVAWQVLNKRRYPHDNRFTDAFLVVAPGITIRDRLRVLLPSDPNNYYKELDIVPTEYRGELGTARIVVTNFHAFKQRERGDAGGLTKRVLTANTPGAFTESPDEMVNRVCNDLGKRREIMVINDEAHHCYRGNPAAAKEKMTREEASEAKARAEEARLWITGLEAVHKKIGVKAVIDLSATPFYLKGSGYPEGTLFPWVASDFSLMDAIECGIVKIPRVPIADNAMTGDYPKYRNLWVDIREGLKDVRRGPEDAHKPPLLPGLLEGALKSLYGHYARKFAEWEADEESRANGSTPPVFIVVCNNTNVSKAVFDYIAGYESEHQHADGEPKVAPGALPLFSNEKDQRWLHQPNTVLVDSRQLESGEGMSDDFKKLAGHQIEDFKAEYRKRFPGRDTENLTDEDLMREVLNTVGKKGKLGEHIRCVVSVSMLTEGWDCNTVTHILGVRAFGTRLLCEQVMGRGLRRRSYAVGRRRHAHPGVRRHLRRPVQRLPRRGAARGTRAGHAEAGQGRACDPGTAARAGRPGQPAPTSKSRSPASWATGSTCPPNGSRRSSTRRTARSSPRRTSRRTRWTRPSWARRPSSTLDEAKELRPADGRLPARHAPATAPFHRPALAVPAAARHRPRLARRPRRRLAERGLRRRHVPRPARVRREEARSLREDRPRHHLRVRRSAAAARGTARRPTSSAPRRACRSTRSRIAGRPTRRSATSTSCRRTATGKPSSARSSKRWRRCGPTPRTRASASASRTPATAGPATTTRT